MTIIYEVNPPKLPKDKTLSDDERKNLLEKLNERMSEINKNCDGIHITDSVLGTKRISPLVASKSIKKNFPDMKITISVRVRDNDITEIEKIVNDAITLGVNGVLILKGDASPDNTKDSGLIPSQVVKHLKELELDKKIDLFLSLPANPDFKKIQKKIDAKPIGFITQVVESVDQVSNLVSLLKPHGFKIIPIVLFPSDKNLKSAQFLKLDWSNYEENVFDFIKKIHDLTTNVLITSPNDFNGVQKTLTKLVI